VRLHNSLCEKAKARCRRIDRAKLKGTGAPMDLFAFDINREAQPQAPDPATHEVSSVIPPPEMTLPELLTKGVEALFLYDQDVLNLQEGLTPVFYSSWDQAFHFYIQGKWTLAADLLSRFSQSFPLFDGPTQTLLQYILSCDLTPPHDWQNFRVLRVK
jgi:hypothetical protein